MSSHLWRFYLEDDVESFRQLLANASHSARSYAQKGNIGGTGGNAGIPIGSPVTALASSPKLTPKHRKVSGWTLAGQGSGGKSQKAFANISLSRADINSTDAQGMTILHHAASSTSPSASLFAFALLEVPLLDLYVQDAESGWTALHRALYFGNITVARALMKRDLRDAFAHRNSGTVPGAGGLIKIKDKEGNSPFDLFGATITSRSLGHGQGPPTLSASADQEDDDGPLEYSASEDGTEHQKHVVKPRVCLNGDELFTFGSNKNFSLGFGDEDDRQYAERVGLKRPDHLLHRFYHEQLSRTSGKSPRHSEDVGESHLQSIQSLKTEDLPSLIKYRPLSVQDVCMSKFHTAVLTTDPAANLYICGFGPGGRLGTGDEITTFNFVCIEGGGLAGKKVVNVGLGQNHTVVITDEGEVFTWGSNTNGQLGYVLPKAGGKGDEPVQTLPRQVFGPLKRETVVGVAASRIHSVVNTASSLYTFGKNEGQLGLVDSDARSLETQVIPRKVAASLFHSSILMVSAIDRATICLLDNHDVWVFANYGYTKVSFPLEGFTNYFLKNSTFTTRYDSVSNHITKITSGGDTICAMSRMGDVFMVVAGQKMEVTSTSASTTNPTKIRNALSQPQRVWSLRKGPMAVRDVDVSQDGSVIICTESGSVWRRVKRAKIRDTSAAGSFDYKPKDYKFSRVPSLTRIIAVRSNTFGAHAAVRMDCDITKSQINVEGHMLWMDLYDLLPIRGLQPEDENSETEFPQLRFWTPLTARNDPATIRRAVLTSADIEADVRKILTDGDSLKNMSYDIRMGTTRSDVLIPIHGFMLAGRSKVFRKALASFRQTYFYSIPDVFTMEYDKDGQTLIMFQDFDFLSILDLVLYIYSDTVVDVWHHTRHAPKSAHRYRQIRTELMKMASVLNLSSLEPAVRVMAEPTKCMHADMERAVADLGYFEDGDLDIELEGRNVRVHSALVCQRCPFFEGLFNGRAAGRWLRDRRESLNDPFEAVKVDLKHVNPAIFSLVLRHIYADTGEELFDEVVTADLEEFLDLIIEVMFVANELMLDRLSQVCQKMLGRFVTNRNVCQLLNAVAPCSVTEFKGAALEYMCLNLEGMLENHLLDDLDEDLLVELGDVVRDNQRACLPFAKSGKAEMELLEKYPELPELMERRRRAKIDSLALRSHLHEDESRFLNTVKGKGGSFDDSASSPSDEKANSKSFKKARITTASPVLKARTSATDLMFDMEDENDQSNAGRTDRANLRPDSHGESRVSTPFHGSVSPSETSKTSLRSDAKAKNIDFEATASSSPALITRPEHPSIADSTEAPGAAIPGPGLSEPTATNSKPWGLSGLSSSKLDMRDIMAQAASTQPSNISLGLAQTSKEERVAGAFTGRVSQRERKKQHQQQNDSQVEHQQQVASYTASRSPSTPTIAAARPVPKSPWQGASTGPKVSLKDVLGTEQQSHANQQSSIPRNSTIPPLTLQQTVPGGSSSTRRAALNNSQSSSPNMPTPDRAIPLSSPQAHAGPPRPSPQPSRHPRSPSRPQPFHPIPTSSSTLSPPTIKSIRHNVPVTPAEPSLQLSMADILSQQQTEKDIIKEAVAKRSLQEIQQEQEFQEWWDEESRKVRLEEEQAAATRNGAEGDGRARRGGGPKGKRGRGGRGRGRGEIRETGNDRGWGEAGPGSASTSVRGVEGRAYPSIRAYEYTLIAKNMAPKSTYRQAQPTDEAVSSQKGVKHMSKRRKLDSDHRDGEFPSRAVNQQRSQLEDEIEHATKTLYRALKVARGFERQKLGRRQKATREKKDGAESARLEAEVAALKALDLSVVAETHLHKTLLKTKSIASAPAFPPRITAGHKDASHLGNVATVNVTARLYNSNPVKTAMTEILFRIRAVLGLGDTEPAARSNNKRGSLMSGNDRSEVPREPRVVLDGKTRSDLGRGASISLSPEWTGFSDDQQVVIAADDDQELDFSMYDARLAGSSDSDSEDDITSLTHRNNFTDINYPQPAEGATSRSPSISASSNSPPPKIRKPVVPPTASTSTFIPSLMGGYWSGSESAEGDETVESNARKNRMGQQARRLLWEKKFGKKANHLKRNARDEGWDPRKGAGGRERGGRGRGGGHDRGPERNYGLRSEGRGSGANSDPVASRMKSGKDEAPLHPSWEAAKKAKELKRNVAFQGKKVVFD